MASAVEEMLRYDAPVQRAWRLAVESVVFGGVTIPAGAMVLAMIGAANRDPAQFAEPDCFDITRADNKHFGFGHGIHFCLGAPLARLEAALAFAALLARFPTLRLASDELEWTHDIALRGLRALPVEI
jgi:cytochrome P450